MLVFARMRGGGIQVGGEQSCQQTQKKQSVGEKMPLQVRAQQRAVLVGVGQDADFPQLRRMGGRGGGEVRLESQFQNRQQQPFSQGKGVLQGEEGLCLVLGGPEHVALVLRAGSGSGAGAGPVVVDGHEDREGLDGVDEPGSVQR